ncbi:hypothetical protein MKK63_24360 [Methylobacterium sp. J-088]|uniref:hypothetical protein n=1 Tax=unclassified Methylobacterium TaxID=2615210 RepID=UPI001FBAE69C|nr:MULTISPECIES: hypothetical protein [unclassified Methylobacterium]MCJ2017598.1 hypothetical protein [Methylobacterium sp. E-065]MCJ2065814.1 hypothetical protein [Methylobacterium sp. J-088]
MTVVSLEARLKRIEEARARVAYRPPLTKAERDTRAATELICPGAVALAYATAEAHPNLAIRERSRAVVAAFWRADA